VMAVVTHGHPRGFCGALFHAFCVKYALDEGKVPSPQQWPEFATRLASRAKSCVRMSNSDYFGLDHGKIGLGINFPMLCHE